MPMDNAEKQKAYRDRERDRKAKHGSRVIKLEVYKGTQDDIAYLMKAGGFEDEKEMLTILIRNAKKNIETNGVKWNKLLDI